MPNGEGRSCLGSNDGNGWCWDNNNNFGRSNGRIKPTPGGVADNVSKNVGGEGGREAYASAPTATLTPMMMYIHNAPQHRLVVVTYSVRRHCGVVTHKINLNCNGLLPQDAHSQPQAQHILADSWCLPVCSVLQ